ncbi:hypothetical protein IFM89_034936 [Coptis chinensis]|uniref:Uncharacterized protein n=1 Tax=Coptis chinensis TaxID=261450 RepID=A0A835LXC6_9MAGN|nr:hypothetical protein IFM89_034936 [Coptis chinensis]
MPQEEEETSEKTGEDDRLHCSCRSPGKNSLFSKCSSLLFPSLESDTSFSDEQNNPLHLQSFTEADDALKLHHIVHCSLDVIDERVIHCAAQMESDNRAVLKMSFLAYYGISDCENKSDSRYSVASASSDLYSKIQLLSFPCQAAG